MLATVFEKFARAIGDEITDEDRDRFVRKEYDSRGQHIGFSGGMNFQHVLGPIWRGDTFETSLHPAKYYIDANFFSKSGAHAFLKLGRNS